MLSILIPTYNFDCSVLVERLVKEGETLNIPFEVIVFDDASTNYTKIGKLKHLQEQVDFKFIENIENRGRFQARKSLAEASNYEWLLFLDADVMPVSRRFLRIYCEQVTNNSQFFFGGITYSPEKPPQQKLLHWAYGKSREERSLESRQKNPYNSIVSANFMIKKDLYLAISPNTETSIYGRDDIVLVDTLKTKQVAVEHLENAVLHLGLEKTQAYINKHLEALDALIFELNSGNKSITERPLVKTYFKLKRFGATKLYCSLLAKFIPKIKANLFSEKPTMRLFDFYRLYNFIKKTE